MAALRRDVVEAGRFVPIDEHRPGRQFSAKRPVRHERLAVPRPAHGGCRPSEDADDAVRPDLL